ncbi:uncharacterized protein LOC123959679 [Micropterus dolomieu]|uniref:uncharacterized protein LOC123959679 n=1 Tax=Micropterus dolomieu TaxID=147949 RepID=UPI001E8E542D|nr:uncharacterized protein LOC123959679 [Micropterus dolomieu]
MADSNLSGPPPPALSAPSHLYGSIGGTAPKHSPPLHHNGSLEARPRCQSPSSTSTVPQPQSASSSRISASTSPLRTPVPGPGSEDSSTRPRFQSFTSALSSRTRSTTSRTKRRSSQQEEPEALLDLILECQGQRLEDQRASLSLLPDPGPAALCGACSPDQPSRPTLDFYCMLIHYQETTTILHVLQNKKMDLDPGLHGPLLL